MVQKYVRKKPIISGTVSPLHKKKIDQLVAEGEFASVSDFINQAVADLLKKYENSTVPYFSNERFTEDEIALLKSIIREKAADMDFEKTERKE